MQYRYIRRLFLIAAGFLILTSSAAAVECKNGPVSHLFGWYGEGEEAVWLYPSAKNSIGLYRPGTQRNFLPDEPPESHSNELVFGGKWRLSWSAADCERPGKVTLTDENGESRALAASPAPYAVKDVRFANDKVKLAGLVLTPRAPGAAIVIVHGSGTSDRDNGSYLTIANALARRGYAVLLPDKRGAGLSEGDWRQVGFAALAGDALAGLEKLTEITGELPRGLLTVSQGGWVGPLAAADTDKRIDFVINLVGPVVTLAEQQKDLLDRLIAEHGFDERTAKRVHAVRLAALAFIEEDSDANWDRYIAARNALLETPAAPLAQNFPESREAWNWAWGRRVARHDPVPLMEQSGTPYLVIYGQNDKNVAVAANTSRIVNSDANITLLVLPDRGHGLAHPAAGTVDAFVFDTIEAWISGQPGRRASP